MTDWGVCRKEAALKKKRELQEKKEEDARRVYQQKQEEESRRTAAAERRIRDLEKVEREMIERLKKTQTLQQKVRTSGGVVVLSVLLSA